MMRRSERIAAVALLALIAAAIAQLAVYYPRLPAVMASHFDGAGSPNGWQSKSSFFILTFAIMAVVVGGMVALPRGIGRMPMWMINLPNKEYWLAPERRAETAAILRRVMRWMAVATTAFIFIIVQLVIEANLSSHPRLAPETAWPLMLGFIAIALGAAVYLMRRFRRPRD